MKLTKLLLGFKKVKGQQKSKIPSQQKGPSRKEAKKNKPFNFGELQNLNDTIRGFIENEDLDR